jgi:hypothetical protein
VTTYHHTIPATEPDPLLALAALLLHSEDADALVLAGLARVEEDERDV